MKRVLTTVIVLVVVGAVGAGAYRMYQLAQHRKQTAMTETDEAPLRVAVARVRKATLENRTAITGEIEPLWVVDVVSKVTGRLERLHLPDGTLIEQGAIIKPDPDSKQLPVIAVVEQEDLEAAVQQAEASLEVAKAALERASVTVADCAREKERFERLFKEGAATKQQLDKTVVACDRSLADQKLAKAQVSQAEAAVRETRVRLGEATIEAPIPGIVVKRYVDPGNMVGPATPLIRIAQIETVKVIGGVSERHFGSVTPGQTPATVAVDAFPGETFRGVVHLVGQAADPATRTIDVEIRIPNPDRRLKGGMFARVNLVLDRKADVPVIPNTAILRDEQGPYVYVVTDSKARRRAVTLGLAEGVLHEVTEGLEPGDRVVVRGQRQLRDGAAVEAIEETQP